MNKQSYQFDNKRPVGIIVNTAKAKAIQYLEILEQALQQHHIDWLYEPTTCTYLNKKPSSPTDIAQVQLWIILGGDGTLLNAVKSLELSKHAVCIINIGTLGFLTSVEKDEINSFVAALSQQKCSYFYRSLLRTKVIKPNTTQKYLCLNEFSLTRSSNYRLAKIDLHVDNSFVNTYRADGVIISSPTGSTAYNVAAGGPIVSPAAKVTIITPICAHASDNKSLIIAEESTISLHNYATKEAPNAMIIDGQQSIEITAQDVISITRHRTPLQIVTLNHYCFYQILRAKLY